MEQLKKRKILKWRSSRTFLGRNLDFLSNPNFLANDFLSSSMCGVQVSFSSTVIPSNRDFDTHSIVEFPMKIGGIFIGVFLPEIGMASLLLGWGVKQLMMHRSFNSRSAEFNWTILFFCRITYAVNRCVVYELIDGSGRHKGRKIEKTEKCRPQNGPLRNSKKRSVSSLKSIH